LLAGRIARIAVRDGQRVRAGQVLAEIEAPEAVRARAEFLRARSHQIQAARALARQRALAQEHATSPNALDEARATAAAAAADLLAAKAVLHSYGADTHGHVAIRAPIAGLVSERFATLGSPVTPDKPLFQLVAPSQVYVAAKLPENVQLTAAPGAVVRLYPRSEGRGEPCIGRVEGVLNVVDLQRRLTVRIAPQACPQLVAGRYVDTELDTSSQLSAAVVVAKEAVVELKGVPIVFVEVPREPGVFEPRAVRLGASTRMDTIVEAGLQAGDRVVDRGVILLKGEMLRAELDA
jgi:cobalt-zinc-cadmium efflux system membrane fusion protein